MSTEVAPVPQSPPGAANGAAPAENGKPPSGDSAAVAPETTKEGQLYAQLRAREAAFVAKQQADARGRSEFENYKKQAQAEIDRATQHAQLAKQDPLRYLKEVHGFTDDAIAARIMSGGKPTAIEETEALKREVAEVRAWKQQREQSEQQAKAMAAQDAALEVFTKTAKGGADKWPLASRAKESRLKARGLEIAIEHAKQGVTLTDEEVLDKLEEELSELVPKAKSDSAASDTSNAPSQATSGQDTKPAPTLTNGAAATKGDASKVDILKMSEAEQTQYVLAELKRLRTAGQIV